MINVTDLRAGTVFIHSDGDPYKVIKYEHIKMGRGSATIKVKAKDLRNGAIKDISFISGARVEEASIIKKEYEYVYFDKRKEVAVFSDLETKKRVELAKDLVGEERIKFLPPKARVTVMELEEEDEIVGIEIPIMVELKVKETAGAERGDTAGSARKSAILETEAVVTVPMFIKVGDIIKVNTETGEYVERAN